MADRSEMARNAIESDFRTSKMATSGHFVKTIHKKNKIVVLVRNAIKSDFWTSKMAAGGHLKEKHLQKRFASDLNNVRTDCWPTTT